MLLEHEIRNYLLHMVLIASGNIPSGRGVELEYARHCPLQLVLPERKPGHYPLKMLVGKVLEAVLEDTLGILHVVVLAHTAQLEQQALPQIPRTHSCRLEILYHGKHPEHLVAVGIDACPEARSSTIDSMSRRR